MNNFLIIDGNNLAYSSYFISKKISKIPNGLIFFFLRTMISLLKKDKYQRMLIIWDGGGDNFRNTLLPCYKAHREDMPNELWEQLKILRALLEKWKIACLQMVNYEADDLIASCINQMQKILPDYFFNIFSQDKDLLQMIGQNISIIKNINSKIYLYTNSDFQKDYNFAAVNYIDYLSFLGDKADNIKGVKKIGPVTAKHLIRQFNTIENVYSSFDHLPSNIKKLLINTENNVIINKKIITLNQNIILPINDILHNSFFDWKKWKNNLELRNFCEDNRFKSIIKLLT